MTLRAGTHASVLHALLKSQAKLSNQIMLANLISISPFYLFILAYIAALTLYELASRSEFKASPEKGNRYRALPIGYKLTCRLIVLPIAAGIVIEPGLALVAMIALTVLQGACRRWYKKAGLL